jgi:hypothetical protein
MSANLLSLPGELAQLLLRWGIGKYIEAAGSAAGAMTARATAIKAIATEASGVVTGGITIAQLQAFTVAELTSKKIAPSTQILVSGLISLISAVVPSANAGLISAALAADANLFLQDVISVCSSYGA